MNTSQEGLCVKFSKYLPFYNEPILYFSSYNEIPSKSSIVAIQLFCVCVSVISLFKMLCAEHLKSRKYHKLIRM